MEDGGGFLRGFLGGLERFFIIIIEEFLVDRGRSFFGIYLGVYDVGGRGSDGEGVVGFIFVWGEWKRILRNEYCV